MRSLNMFFWASVVFCVSPAFSKAKLSGPEEFVVAVETTNIKALQKAGRGGMIRNAGTPMSPEFIAISPAEVIERYRGCKGEVAKLPLETVDADRPLKSMGYIIWQCQAEAPDASKCYDDAHQTGMLYVGKQIRYVINMPFQTWSEERCGPIPPMSSPKPLELNNG